ncbi:DUF4173 domain-containing protein [Ruminiclostridium herbifermentans]|uniref:DUF4173 domain-containing protein n=2 Tax=Ruminiclostridium herbifermentans TaxID=2488810 RepID=A0A4U7JA35_9FIRM|nr:DUF4173 domain-containing protein [Ruminiclostridium herbifermentans]
MDMPPNYSYYTPYIPRNKTLKYIAFKEKVTSIKGLYISVLSILFCILFTETILLGSAGISVPILAIALECMLFYFFKEPEKPINKASVYLAPPILLLAFSFFIHYNPSTQFITWLTIMGLLCIQIIVLADIEVNGLFSFDMLSKSIVNLIGRPISNFAMPFISFKIIKNNKSKALANSIYIFIGLAISIPIAAILMGLFMSADAVFAESMNTVKNLIGLDFRVAFWDIVLGSLFGLFFGAMILGLKYEEKKQTPAAKIGDNIESIIIGTFLTIINIFIITFVVFQFMYLFGGTVNISASDMTYAEYARRGFFELTTASGIIFAIALSVLIMTKKKNGKLPLWIQLTTVCLCLCNDVLLISAMKRMLLYVDIYGLSVKRVLTLWFMILIGFCLLWLIIKCFINNIYVMNWIGITVIVGVCILSLINVDRIIANYNVNRYLSSPTENSIDINYLGQLSYSAVPEIIRLKGLDEGSNINFDIKNILEHHNFKLQYRHKLYGFTIDMIEASSILNREFK